MKPPWGFFYGEPAGRTTRKLPVQLPVKVLPPARTVEYVPLTVKTTCVPDAPALAGKFSATFAVLDGASERAMGTELEFTPLSVALVTWRLVPTLPLLDSEIMAVYC